MTTAIQPEETASAAIMALLQDQTLQDLVSDRIVDDLAEDQEVPCLLYVIMTATDRRGLWTGNLPELTIRTHAFSRDGGLIEAQRINARAVALLKDADLDVTAGGFLQCGQIVFRETSRIPDSILNGVKVHELVSTFTAWMEQNA